MTDIHLTAEELEPIVKRLRRAQGQLGGIVAMIEDGRDCGDVVMQLAAVSKAVDRAGFAMIATGLEQCIVNGESSDAAKQRLEKLFMSLT